MATFYGNSQINGYICNDKYTIPSLFALYDTLNDDDDEIRDLGASTVSSLLGKSLVPLAAQMEFANWISMHHSEVSLFAWNVVRRMTGSTGYEAIENSGGQIRSAEDQFFKAMKDDDSLFVEEEQNLFIDEIREAELWCQIFEKVSIDRSKEAEVMRIWGKPHEELADWVLKGLEALSSLLAKADGPLGWTSKPAVFSICMRIVLSANSILRHHEDINPEGDLGAKSRVVEEIANALEKFSALGKEKRIHERLLFEVAGRQKTIVTDP